jgi:hypothetical protein
MNFLTWRQVVRSGLVVAALVAGVCLPLYGSARAAETAPHDFQLTAEAQGLQVTLIDPGAPLIQRYDASPYGASAALTSLGTSAADAGAPYSPVIAALPGTISGLGGATGQFPPVPPLPGYVYSSYPVRETDRQAQGAYTISATSAEDHSEGLVSVGSSAPGDASTLFSAATVKTNPDGTVTTSGRSGIDRIKLGGVLDIANISSLASITKDAGKPSAYTTTTNLGAVTLDSAKLDLAGQAQHQKLTPAVISGLNTVLAPAGVVLTYLPAQYVFADGSKSTQPVAGKVIQSVDSAALQVDMTRDVPGQGTMLVRMTLGRVLVGATNDATALPVPSLGGPLGTATAGAAGPVVDNIADAGVLPSTSSGAVPAGPPMVATGNSAPAVFSGRLPLGPSGETLYLVLALAAVAALGCARLMKEKS